LQELLKLAPSREREIYLDDLRDQDAGAQGRRGGSKWASRRCSRRAPSDIRTAYERLGRALCRDAAVSRRRFAAYEKTVQLDAHNTKAAVRARASSTSRAARPLKATDVPAHGATGRRRTRDDIGRAGRARDRSRGDGPTRSASSRRCLSAAVVHDGAQADLSPRARRSVPALRTAPRRARKKHGTDEIRKGGTCRAHADRRPTACSRCSRRLREREGSRPSRRSRSPCSARSRQQRGRPPRRWSTWRRSSRRTHGRIGTLQEKTSIADVRGRRGWSRPAGSAIRAWLRRRVCR